MIPPLTGLPRAPLAIRVAVRNSSSMGRADAYRTERPLRRKDSMIAASPPHEPSRLPAPSQSLSPEIVVIIFGFRDMIYTW